MVSKELVDYIKRIEGQGRTPQQLREQLIQSGYSPEEVDDALAGAQNDPSSGFQTSDTLRKRPVSITIIVILIVLSSLYSIGMNIFALIAGASVLASIPVIGAIFGTFFVVIATIFILLGVFNLFVARGLWKLQNWARRVAIFFSILTLLTIIGIPLAIIFLYIFFKKSTKEAFGVA